MFTKIKQWLMTPIANYKAKKAKKERLKKLREQDPFIYE